ncbi:hypothetical protein [Flavobacterium hiemivividum]|uniref:hypothetical protein n=1 Tax=Flavobacterium hiemivividum TaxID=2541734 RepID=UPI001404E5EA|nr:hypothetical protein [Flavobacterium hiemivividum]
MKKSSTGLVPVERLFYFSHYMICNSLRPQSHSGHATNIQQFYDETRIGIKN